mgnify:CR=1 FL=1
MDKIKDLAEEYFIENLVADEGGHLARFGEIAYKAGVADALTATGSMESAFRTHESRATDDRDLAYRMYRNGSADTEARLAVLVDQYRKALEGFGVIFADNGFIRKIPRSADVIEAKL